MNHDRRKSQTGNRWKVERIIKIFLREEAFFYSCLKAFTGASFAALLAGQTPAATPTISATRNPGSKM
jgi:hypothetical protein